MATFQDLSLCHYFGELTQLPLIAVGWLGVDQHFATGTIPVEVFAKLKKLISDPWQPIITMGAHECEICQFDPCVGAKNLFVPDGLRIFVCPELIIHYIAAHRYQPPDEFLAAVMNCPDTRTMDYKKLFLASGGRALISPND